VYGANARSLSSELLRLRAAITQALVLIGAIAQLKTRPSRRAIVTLRDGFGRGGWAMTVTVEFPLTLPSVANLREHWATKAKRVKAQRRVAFFAMNGRINPLAIDQARGRIAVTLTRVAPRKLDSDNLQSAFKAIRDEVAAYFGVDDADPRIEWRYAQARGKAAVRIEFNVEPSPKFEADWLKRGMPLEYSK
jgi:hypothetical protein